MGDYYLIGTDIGGDDKFAVCEIYDEGSDYLDIDGISFLDKIDLEGGENTVTYDLDNVSFDLDADLAFCEYQTDEDYNNYLLVCRTHESVMVYRGVAIGEDSIII